MRTWFQIALGIVIGAASVITAKADGLVPCDGREQGFVEDLADDSEGSNRGEVVLSYLDLPALWTGWGNFFVGRAVRAPALARHGELEA